MAERIATTASMIFCALCALAGTAKASECGELLPPSNVADNRSGVTPEQLLKLRDIGQAYGGDPRRHLFTFSPDQQSISFQIHRADTSTNRERKNDVSGKSVSVGVESGGSRNIK